MAFLKPDRTMTLNGVTVNEYFLTKHNTNKISLPSKMTKPLLGVTLHNTEWISVDPTTTPAEQYTRSTINGNMNSVRVHFYVDDKGAWQNLPLDYQSWHSGHKGRSDAHGSEKGNQQTISIECIMDGSKKDYSLKSRDNAARLAAYLLYSNGFTVNDLYTHNYWENIRNGKTGSIDRLNKLNDGYKNCPVYIRPQWDDFKAKVSEYMQEIDGSTNAKYYVQVGAFSVKSLAENYLAGVKEKYPDSFIKYVKAAGLYYVQTGAFASKANAEKYLEKVKKDYPEAFVKIM